MAELERGKYGIEASERDVRLAGQTTKGVQPGLGMPQRVELEAIQALGALAVVVVRLGDVIAVEQEDLDDLGAIVLGGQDERRDVGRELRVVWARRLPERVRVTVDQLLLVDHLVLRVLQYGLGYLCVAHVDREQEGLLYLRAVRFAKQGLNHLKIWNLL